MEDPKGFSSAVTYHNKWRNTLISWIQIFRVKDMIPVRAIKNVAFKKQIKESDPCYQLPDHKYFSQMAPGVHIV